MGEPELSNETLAVHAGERRPGPDGSVVFPIYQSTVYEVPPGTPYDEIKYLRLSSTPSQEYLHDKLAILEGAESALATASGMAAVTTILLTELKSGDHLLVGDCLYGGTYAYIREYAEKLGWTHSFVDAQRPESWESAMRDSTRGIVVETITNPLMRVPPLQDVVQFAWEHGLFTVIDNTFASPINFRPLGAGFDYSFHSATKYLNGHSDLVAGCVLSSRDNVDRVRHTLNHLGGSLDPHAGFLLARGLKTLALRVAAQNRNGLALARDLDDHPAVTEMHYPGLPSHPDHDHAKQLLSGFGGMLSFRLARGMKAAERFLSRLRIPYVAPSLGGVESLVTRPAATSHASLPPEDRAAMGIHEDLIRVSCGIEGEKDLITDFRQALE